MLLSDSGQECLSAQPKIFIKKQPQITTLSPKTLTPPVDSYSEIPSLVKTMNLNPSQNRVLSA